MIKQKISIKVSLVNGFKLWKTHFYKIAIVVFIVYLPVQILIEFSTIFFDRLITTDDIEKMRLMNNVYNLIRYLIGSIATLGVINYIYMILSVDKNDQNLMGIVKHGIRKWPDFISVGIIAGLKVLLYTLLLIIPGIYKSVRFSFIDCAVATKDHSGNKEDSGDYCEYIVDNNWWRIFGFLIVIFLIEMLIEIVIAIPFINYTEIIYISIFAGILIRVFTIYLIVVKTNYFYEIERLIKKEDNNSELNKYNVQHGI